MKPFRKRMLQFVEFALVGVLNALISWSVYALCIRLGLHYIPATAIGFSVSMVNATFWNRRVVFKKDKQSWWKSFVKTYIAYSVTALFLNSLLLHLWIDVLEIGEYFTPAYHWLLGKGIRLESSRRLAEYSMPFFNYCITVPLNYTLNKFWAFRASEKGELNSMKILCITRKFPPQVGGMENFSFHLFQGIARENPQTKQITLGKKQIHLLWYFPYLVFYVMFCARKYDVMYLSDGLMCFLGNVARVFAPKTKRVVTIHGLDVTYSNKLYQLYLKMFFKKSFDEYICDSEYTQEVVDSFGNLTTKVVKLGINVDKFDRINKKPAMVEEYIEDKTQPLLCLTVGRLVRRKGVLWFLRNVMPQLMDAHVKYVVAGDGPDRGEIEKAVEELHLEEKVKICGRVPDDILNQLYLNADVFVMPNISVENDVEGFGLVALEGSLSGAVVVASGIEGIKDAITDGKNGILLESGNAKAYIDKILEIEKNRESYKSLGKEFSTYTKENCSYDRVTRDYMHEFKI